MFRPYTLLSLLIALGTQAQRAHIELPPHPTNKAETVIPGGYRGTAGQARGVAFYTETFDSDLNGWTVQTDVGQVDWHWTDTGPGPTSSTYPVPPLNTEGGWAILDDDFEGVSGQSSNASLISPMIDLSNTGTPYLKVEFDQYFQEFQLDTTFVGVSTDGGASWEEVLINENVGRDGRPNPELVDVDITALVAPDPSNVMIRFRYVGTWDYGWQVDNIAIRELPANDMAILRASSNAFDFAATGFENMAYSIYPQTQVNSMTPDAVLKNKGYLTQNNVVLSVEVEGPVGSELITTSSSFQFTPTSEGSVDAETFTPSGAIGDYTMTFNVEQTETDEVPENNMVVNTFKVSDNVYGHDDGATQSAIGPGVDNENDAYEVGHHFMMVQDNMLTGIQVAIHESTPVGAAVHGALYNPDNSAGQHPSLMELTDDHFVTEADLNGAGDANFITMLFDNPIPVYANETYLVMAGTFDGSEGLRYAYSGSSEAQISIIHYPDLPEDFEFYLTRTPMVRMLLTSTVGTEDAHNTSGPSIGNRPNPFSSSTTIDYTLPAPGPVLFSVTDITGKTVRTVDLGTRPAGPDMFELDGSDLAPGIYTCTIRSGAQLTSHRITVVR
ncbi:MAG: T9SS type A sorting domain-containing protein [Flavobacteriales bacterium]|nr:T9SS type A sorting domain-containing protein [Flavobacteriales bacterium]